eukprot:CAMPEP_0177589428 /NCGR_PEP_ID=MMETSP0419_2-20121207/6800_1 /TAXON_ID=582737 /ORGANISM="Tetraselmis sp., Strain GSL018" /LENGTH=93 /DNA_ID=CAMNT_0019079785 /DNA_START=357 /DNA_END=639 /DNA_ORIENTATION=+
MGGWKRCMDVWKDGHGGREGERAAMRAKAETDRGRGKKGVGGSSMVSGEGGSTRAAALTKVLALREMWRPLLESGTARGPMGDVAGIGVGLEP